MAESKVLSEQLSADIGAERVISDPDIVATYRSDQAVTVPAGWPAVVVRAVTAKDVQHTLRIASRLGVPVVPRGTGTGLSGGANAIDGCIVLSLEALDRVVEVDAPNQMAVVQPGVINAELKKGVSVEGLWYPPDPASASISTIGGNVATNAGGLCCIKYGVTRDWVLGLTVVLPSGEVVKTGRRTLKDVAGYDLTGLFVGSEGTLGVVTEVIVRLRPPPPPPSTLVAFFPTLESAGTAVVDMGGLGAPPSLLELLDAPTIQAVDEWKRMELDPDAAALLIAQSDAEGDARQSHIETLEHACIDAGASFTAVTNDSDEGEQLLTARRLAYPALERLGATLLDDVGVPRSRLPELLSSVQRIGETYGVSIYTFGHAGDGNMHPTLVFDRSDPEEHRRVQEAFVDILRAALEMGGTITGEHGVGALKRALLIEQLDPGALGLQLAIKSALDPAGILNPGKVLPTVRNSSDLDTGDQLEAQLSGWIDRIPDVGATGR